MFFCLPFWALVEVNANILSLSSKKGPLAVLWGEIQGNRKDQQEIITEPDYGNQIQSYLAQDQSSYQSQAHDAEVNFINIETSKQRHYVNCIYHDRSPCTSLSFRQ